MDLLISLNDDKLNQCLLKLFNNPAITETIFKGSVTDSFENIQFTIDWEVKESPRFALRRPYDQEWINAIKRDGAVALPVDDSFIILLPALFIRFYDGTETRSTQFPLIIIGHIANDGSGILLSAEAVSIDLSGLSEMDQYAAREVFIPEILAAVNKAVAGLNIPAPSFEGVTLTPPRAEISNRNLVVAFNLIDKGQPELNHFPVPDKPFFIMASQELLRIAANYVVTTKVQGQTFKKSDRIGGSVASAEYNINAYIDRIHIEPTGNPTVLHTIAGMRADARAAVTFDPSDLINPTKW